MAGAVRIQLGEEDVVAASRHLLLLRFGLRRSWAGGGPRPNLLGEAIVWLLIAAFLIAFWPPGWGLILAWMVLLVIVVPISIWLRYLELGSRGRRLFRQQAALHEPLDYEWSDTGFSYASSRGDARFVWTELYRWDEAAHGFMLFTTEESFFLLPRRLLSAAQADDLRATVAAHGPGPG